MRKFFLTLLLFPGLCFGAGLYSNTTPDSTAIWLGSPHQAVRYGLVIKVEVPMQAGEIAIALSEGQGSIYQYPDRQLIQFKMFLSSQLVVFAPGLAVPSISPASIPGALPVSSASGADVGVTISYYSPQTKAGTFQAPADGVYTFAMYWWGGSSEAGTGNAASVYPGTSRISVVVH